MSRYNTRFQVRKQASQVQVIEQPSYPKEDVDFLKECIERSDNLIGADHLIKSMLDMFSYLAVHQAFLHHPIFRSTLSKKITQMRPQIENEKKRAIDTFVSLYSPHGNESFSSSRLEAARRVLYYSPLLEAEIKKVESILSN
jgi:hypothetical protein